MLALSFWYFSKGLVECDCLGQPWNAPPSPLWIQLPDSWQAQLWSLEKGVVPTWNWIIGIRDACSTTDVFIHFQPRSAPFNHFQPCSLFNHFFHPILFTHNFFYTFWGYFLEPFFLHFFNTFFTLFGTLLMGKKMCEWLTDRGTDGRGAGRCFRCFTSKMCCFLLLVLLTSCLFFFCKI